MAPGACRSGALLLALPLRSAALAVASLPDVAGPPAWTFADMPRVEMPKSDLPSGLQALSGPPLQAFSAEITSTMSPPLSARPPDDAAAPTSSAAQPAAAKPAAAKPASSTEAPPPAAERPVGPKNVEQTVTERIDRDGRRLGASTERLVAIQESIRTVEREVLDKVFDMASLKAFYERHEQELDARRSLMRNRAALVGKVNAMSSQLTEAEVMFRQQAKEHETEKKEMTEKVANSKKQVAQVSASIEAKRRFQQENFELERSNAALKEQNVKSLTNLQEVMKALQREGGGAARRIAAGEVAFDDACEAKLKALEAQLKAVEAAEAASISRLTSVKTRGWKALQAVLQYNAALKSRLQKAKANLLTIQSQVVVTTEQHAALHLHGEKELKKLRAELGQLREQLAYLENTLTGTVLARQAIKKEIRILTEQINELEMRLMSGELAALKANNTRLRSALTEAQVVNQDTENVMAEAHANVTRENVTLTELRRTTDRNNNLAQRIARNFLAQIVAAKNRGAAAMEEAEQEAMLAESVQQSDCDGVWDKRNPKILGELETCKTVKDDLAAANAQIASLSSLASAGGVR